MYLDVLISPLSNDKKWFYIMLIIYGGTIGFVILFQFFSLSIALFVFIVIIVIIGFSYLVRKYYYIKEQQFQFNLRDQDPCYLIENIPSSNKLFDFYWETDSQNDEYMHDFYLLCQLRNFCQFQLRNLQKRMKSYKKEYKEYTILIDHYKWVKMFDKNRKFKKEVTRINLRLNTVMSLYTIALVRYLNCVEYLEFIESKMMEIFNPDEFINRLKQQHNNDILTFIGFQDYYQSWILLRYRQYISDKLQFLGENELFVIWETYWQKRGKVQLKNGLSLCI